MLAGMIQAMRSVWVPFLCFAAALPGQQPGGQPKQDPAEAAKTAPAARRQDDKDPVMAKDPAILAIDKFIGRNKVDTKQPDWRTRLVAPPLAPFDQKSEYFWHVETSKGLIVVRLFPDTAPMHVTTGIYLARLGYYDGLKFHRIIKQFMAQGGCPLGNGGGGPGFTIDGEFFGNRRHDKPGVLSTANTGMPKTDGSQFFLTFVPTPHLDGKHTIWGEVVDGMEALKALEAAGSAGDQKLAEPPTIVRTWIQVKKSEPVKAKAKDGAKPAPAGAEPTPAGDQPPK
jgi:cyclophilin family peptidyl-prolyl cis-trans isomerase